MAELFLRVNTQNYLLRFLPLAFPPIRAISVRRCLDIDAKPRSLIAIKNPPNMFLT